MTEYTEASVRADVRAWLEANWNPDQGLVQWRTFAGMLGHVGLEQALVVSHDPALLAALPNRIVVDKDGSSSTARVE